MIAICYSVLCIYILPFLTFLMEFSCFGSLFDYVGVDRTLFFTIGFISVVAR